MKKPKLNLSKIGGTFKTRAFRVGSYSVAATVIVVAIAVVINLIAAALPAKYTKLDTTASQLFSISDQTEKLVTGLTQDVTIYYLVQSGYEDSNVETLLGRYASLSSHIHVVKKDPDVYPTFVQQYVSDGIYNNSLIVECGDRYRYVDYYEIYEYDYSSYYYTGSYTVSFAGESSVTSAIDYVLSEDLPKVYLLSGHGEGSLSTTFSTAVERENIETAELSLISEGSIPEDADCILICAPRSDLAAEELEMLRAYLDDGGCLMVVADPPDDLAMTNLEALLADYGVTAAEGIVVEGSQSYYAWGTPYYLLPDYGDHEITQPLVDSGYYVLLPIAQGLNIGQAPAGVTVTELLGTSSLAFSKVAGYGLTTYEKEDGDISGPFSLAVAIEDSNTGSSMVWVSSAALLDDETNAQVSGGNQDLFLNALNWMCQPEQSSISIHAKSLAQEYLTMDSATSATLSILTIGVIPVCFLAVGIVVVIRRKRR